MGGSSCSSFVLVIRASFSAVCEYVFACSASMPFLETAWNRFTVAASLSKDCLLLPLKLETVICF